MHRFMMGAGGATMLAAGRAFVTFLIAVCLTFAPIAGARAMHAAFKNTGALVAAADHAPDCHKAKRHHDAPASHACCDRGSKSKCPDEGCGCAFGCGAQTLAVFATPEPLWLTGASGFESPDSAGPPGLRLNPQGPPPRA
jgi:hypothetical protein